jgi:hypothetical protein
MKKLFIIVIFVLGVALVAMLLTKPEPKEHYDAMIGLAQNVVDQEMTSNNVKKTMAQMGAKNWQSWALKVSMQQRWSSWALMWI